jgi:hypothetical protein
MQAGDSDCGPEGSGASAAGAQSDGPDVVAAALVPGCYRWMLSEGSGAVACEEERLDRVLGYRAKDVSVDVAQRPVVEPEPVGLDPVDAGDAGVAG